MKLEVGMYVRTIKGIAKIETIEEDRSEISFNCDTGLSISFVKRGFTQEEMAKQYKHSFNITDLIEPMDLMYIDISPDDCGGIVVPRVAETLNELEEWKERFSNGSCILKRVVTHEQIESISYKVGE